MPAPRREATGGRHRNGSESPTAEHFRVVLGDAVRGGEERWRYRCGAVAPSCVVLPADVEGVSAAVRTAAEAGMAIVACGNGTHLDIGWPPQRYDAALSTGRLDRILDHDAADMTVTVQAGVILGDLNRMLAREGQMLPLDPPRADEMTIGGLLAADRNGPLRLSCGRARDLLIGVRVVTANGQMLRGGGRVVKNVAGYDLPKLFIGSFGTLGVIVEATFKLVPRPVHERVFCWPAASIEEATANAARVLESNVAPALLEAVNLFAAEAMSIGEDAALIVGCSGGEEEIVAAELVLRGLAGGALSVYPAARGSAILRAVREFAQSTNDDRLVARVSVLPAALPALLRRLEEEAAARAIGLEIAAHAGNGIAWCVLSETAAPLTLELFAEWMRVYTRGIGGWVVFESIPERLRDGLDPWGFNAPTLTFMRRIKTTLDPGNVFSPGRFVGGI